MHKLLTRRRLYVECTGKGTFTVWVKGSEVQRVDAVHRVLHLIARSQAQTFLPLWVPAVFHIHITALI